MSLAIPRARMLLTLCCFLASLRTTFAADADLVSFTASHGGSTSIEEVVSGLMSLRTVMDAQMISKIKWSLQNSLAAFCGSGTQVVAGAIWKLPALNDVSAEQDLELPFNVLPLPGKSGACAQALTSASTGGIKGSWTETNPQPKFRKMLEDQFSALGGSLIVMTSAVVRLWRITCLRRPVVIPPGTPRSNGASSECSSFSPGWEVYSTQNAWTALSRLNNSIGFGTVSVETGGSDSDSCSKAATPCLCSQLSGCSWLPHPSGSKRCQKGDRVSCAECWQQSSCSPDCLSATDACSCAAFSPSLRCQWLPSTASCGPQPLSAMAPNISCSACVWQEKCASLAPMVESLSPSQFTLMTRFGPGSLLTANFSSSLRPENMSGFGSVLFYCGRDGQPSSRNTLQSRKYVMPAFGLSTDGDRTLILDTTTVHVQQESKCEVIFEAGVVEGVHGLPSQLFSKGHSIVMPDTVAPQVIGFTPFNNQVDVPLETSEIALNFDERIFVPSVGFRAFLTPLAIRGSARLPPVLLPVLSIQDKLVTLSIPRGLLQTGTLYTVNISAQSVRDLDKNNFPGLANELYTFTTEGVFVDVRVVSQEGLTPFTFNIIVGSSAAAGCCMICGILLFLRFRWRRGNKTGHSPANSSETPSPELFQREKLSKQASTAIATVSTPCASNGWAWVFDESDEQVKVKPGSQSVVEYGRPIRGNSPATSRTNTRNPVNRNNVDPTNSIRLQRSPLQLTNDPAHQIQLREAASFVERKKLLN